MTTNLNEIFTVLAESLEDLSKGITKDSSSYQFEASLNILERNYIDHSIYVAHLGGHDLFFDKVLDVRSFVIEDWPECDWNS